MFTKIYIPNGPLAKRLAQFKQRRTACAHYPSRAVVGEKVPGYFVCPMEPGGTRYLNGRSCNSDRMYLHVHHGWDGYHMDPDNCDDAAYPATLALPHGRHLAGWQLCNDGGEPINDEPGATFDVSTTHTVRDVVRAAKLFAEQEASDERAYQENEREKARLEEEKEERQRQEEEEREEYLAEIAETERYMEAVEEGARS